MKIYIFIAFESLNHYNFCFFSSKKLHLNTLMAMKKMADRICSATKPICYCIVNCKAENTKRHKGTTQ